jgi:hypothetical protein
MTEHPRGRMAAWILVALAGLAIAVILSVAASNLSTQPIGLSNEPLRASDRLAPPTVTRTRAATKKARARVKRRTPTPTRTTPAPTPTPTVTATTPTTTTDDHGGTASSGSGGHGSDDPGGRRDSDD